MDFGDSKHKPIQKRVKLKNEGIQKPSRPGSVKKELNQLTDTVEAALNEVSDIMLSQKDPK